MAEHSADDCSCPDPTIEHASSCPVHGAEVLKDWYRRRDEERGGVAVVSVPEPFHCDDEGCRATVARLTAERDEAREERSRYFDALDTIASWREDDLRFCLLDALRIAKKAIE